MRTRPSWRPAIVLAFALLAPSSIAASSGAATTDDPPSIVAAGSSVTKRVMDQVLRGSRQFNLGDRGAANETVVGDAFCNQTAYGPVSGAGVFPVPEGSDAGRDALKRSVAGVYPSAPIGAGRGCIDIARSDVGPRPAEPSGDSATFQYFAFALDAVMWASPSMQAPPFMSRDQLRAIYQCEYTDWAQVGGGPGPIQRFLPPPSSGERHTFVTGVLGLWPEYSFSEQPAPEGSVFACPAAIEIQESKGTQLLLESPNHSAFYDRAILPYSAGRFVMQSTNRANPTLDLRGGIRPGGLVLGHDAGSAPRYPVRWTGTGFRLNDATVSGPGTRSITDASTSGGLPPEVQPDTTLSSPTAAFTNADLGKTLQGSCVAPGTVVAAVVSSSEVEIVPPSLTQATACSVTIGPALVGEAVLQPGSAGDESAYPGVRYLSNVIDTESPSSAEARGLVGFEDAPGGAASALCSGALDSTILSEGFLDLRPQLTEGGNIATCRLREPFVPVSGSGSTYVALAMQQWIADAQTRGWPVSYLPTGSPDGLGSYARELVDFAGSEVEFSALAAATDGVDIGASRGYQYVPSVAGGIAVMHHVVASGGEIVELRLSPRTIARIFMGDIATWSDPAIAADNPGLELPDQPITVVYRSGQAGTTGRFYEFVAHSAPDLFGPWAAEHQLPTTAPIIQLDGTPGFAPQTLALNGSDQIAQFVAGQSGEWSIAYDEFAYAVTYAAPVAQIRNASGNWVLPHAESVSAALESATLRADLSPDLSGVFDSADPVAYPISLYSSLVIPCAAAADRPTCQGSYADRGVERTMARWLRYIACEGQVNMARIGYAPLPPNLSQEVANAIGRLHGTTPELLTADNCSNPKFVVTPP